jgi:hypothetical protein
MDTILEVHDETFKDIVARDVHAEASPEEQKVLFANTRLWLHQLNSLSRDVEIQLAAHNVKLAEARAEAGARKDDKTLLTVEVQERRWKVGALRFKASIESRIHYVKRLRSQQDPADVKAS